MTSPPLIPVLIQNAYVGCLLNRGRAGWEVYDRDDQSIGVFKTPSDAVAALIAAATPPEPEAA